MVKKSCWRHCPTLQGTCGVVAPGAARGWRRETKLIRQRGCGKSRMLPIERFLHSFFLHCGCAVSLSGWPLFPNDTRAVSCLLAVSRSVFARNELVLATDVLMCGQWASATHSNARAEKTQLDALMANPLANCWPPVVVVLTPATAPAAGHCSLRSVHEQDRSPTQKVSRE